MIQECRMPEWLLLKLDMSNLKLLKMLKCSSVFLEELIIMVQLVYLMFLPEKN